VATVSVSGTLTDGGVDGVSLTPTLPDSDGDGISEILVASAFAGGPVNLGVDIGPATTTAGAYGPFSLGPEAGPSPGPVTELSLSLGFLLSGGSDVVSLSGLLTLDPAPVPEPGTLWLLVPGIAAIALRHRRR
jgi:hypothetical protein